MTPLTRPRRIARAAAAAVAACVVLSGPVAASAGRAVEPGAMRAHAAAAQAPVPTLLADFAAAPIPMDPAGPEAWTAVAEVPAGTWHYRIAPGGNPDVTIGASPARDAPDRGITLHDAGAITFVFEASRRAVADDTADPLAFASDAGPGTCPSAPPAAPPVPGQGVPVLDPDGDGVATAALHGLSAGPHCLVVSFITRPGVTQPAPTATTADIPADAPRAVITLALDTRDETVSTWTLPAGVPAADGHLDPGGFDHDSRDPGYRSPGGAIPAGTPLRLRLRTYHGDATGATLVVKDAVAKSTARLPMAVVVAGMPCGAGIADATALCDWWEATLTPTQPTTLTYRFEVTDGAATEYLADDALLDGGRGQVTTGATGTGWTVTVHVPGVTPVPWLDGAVVYQIFPDRFRNGNPANDVNVKAPRYAWPPDTTDQNTRRAWGSPPERPSRGADWFGGDLAGITQNLDYLQRLGVTVLYLNPIFSAASNHAYDTRDYTLIDPRFGDPAAWATLVKAADAHGMHIVLDGVFNHVSSDSPYFDRYHHFPTVGACESVASPYRSWFTFTPEAGGPCAGPDGPNTMTYAGWSNLASLPTLVKTDPGVRSLVFGGADSIATRWLRAGASGWRLDVMPDPSFGTGFWPAFRTAVKGVNPDAVIVGELWGRDDVLPRLRGDTADTTMNYLFRNAVTGYLGTIDSKGFPDAGQSNQPPSLFARKELGILEIMPAFAARTAWNLLDSHDTERILWSLAPPGDAASKESKASLALAKARLRLASLLQFTLPGAPTIYYGDEIGMTGADDPDDRRTFPVLGPGGALPASADAALHGWYVALAALRRSSAVLRDGDVRLLIADDRARTLAFARVDGAGGLAIVALNPNPDAPATLRIPLGDALGPRVGVPDGVAFLDALAGGAAGTSSGGFLSITLPALGAAVLVPATAVPPALGAPSGIAAVFSAGAVTISWQPVAGAGSYVVSRSALPDGGFDVIGRADGTSFADTFGGQPALGGTWHYLVRAVDAAGWQGAAGSGSVGVVGVVAAPAATGTAASPSPVAPSPVAPSPVAPSPAATASSTAPPATPSTETGTFGVLALLAGAVLAAAIVLVVRRRSRR